mmetsp:Transcript_25035/g.62903  ORF Transcript_25035/g.62903 Transcript_25035/m.62903 type:complete len:235 (-) Transcript_25035:1260-1964(-)
MMPPTSCTGASSPAASRRASSAAVSRSCGLRGLPPLRYCRVGRRTVPGGSGFQFTAEQLRAMNVPLGSRRWMDSAHTPSPLGTLRPSSVMLVSSSAYRGVSAAASDTVVGRTPPDRRLSRAVDHRGSPAAGQRPYQNSRHVMLTYQVASKWSHPMMTGQRAQGRGSPRRVSARCTTMCSAARDDPLVTVTHTVELVASGPTSAKGAQSTASWMVWKVLKPWLTFTRRGWGTPRA